MRQHYDKTKCADLRRMPMLAGARDRDLAPLARALDYVDIPAGQALVREGTSGREVYFILEGAVEIEVDGRTVCRAGAGDVIGELAALGKRARCATVRTLAPTSVLVAGPAMCLTVLEHPLVASWADRVRDERLAAVEAARAANEATTAGAPAGMRPAIA